MDIQKKTAHALEQEREDVLKRRQDWFDLQPDLDPQRLVFIDETSLSTKMARLRGRALRGERCRAGVPHGHWKTTTFTGGLRLTGLTAPFVHDGPMNSTIFQVYVERVLIPTLKPGDIVVMDNLPAHKLPATQKAIEQAGAELMFLPPYTRTLTPSKWPSQNSRPCCAPEPNGLSALCGMLSPRCFQLSHTVNAPVSLQPLDMSRIKVELL